MTVLYGRGLQHRGLAKALTLRDNAPNSALGVLISCPCRKSDLRSGGKPARVQTRWPDAFCSRSRKRDLRDGGKQRTRVAHIWPNGTGWPLSASRCAEHGDAHDKGVLHRTDIGHQLERQMLEYAMAIGIVAGSVLGGIAGIIAALAWYRWAGRCDPKNPNFRPPLISRRP